MLSLPGGTVTFLFTDIEGSTPLWEQHPEAMSRAVSHHHTILRDSIEAHCGHVFNIAGDAFCAAFATASDGLAAALAAQHALHAAAWGETPIRVRMGLHSGNADAAGDDYRSGPTLNRVARVMALAHGGQILLSQATAELARGRLPDGVTLRDLGEHRLKGLPEPERILLIVAEGLPAGFAPLKSPASCPNNLPLQLTSFIGRERDMAEVKHWLSSARLVTLTGAGGAGKTRLAIQVAGELLDGFPDGTWFVELAPLADPAFVPNTVASALSVPEQPGRPLLATLTDYLRDKNLLLILDNCEHLIEASARLADALLHAAPLVKILATSREAMGIGGEVAWRVPSLEIPTPTDQPLIEKLTQFASVQLFVERATFALHTFALTPTNAPAVAQVCHRLDGMPLAIELAAARVKALSVEQISARLDDRFRLLTTGGRMAVQRQQTLRAAIDWSYDLLSEPERMLLRRLSVFAGGWTLEAAESVVSSRPQVAGESTSDALRLPLSTYDLPGTDVLDLLTRLVEKSLVVAEEQGGEARYRMLETIRQYAHEKLLESGESEGVRTRHLDFFTQFVLAAEPALEEPNQVDWLNRLEREHDNLRAALRLTLERNESAVALRLTGALGFFWFVRGYWNEGRQWLQHALDMAPRVGAELREYRAVLAKALVRAGMIAGGQGDYPTAQALYLESLTLNREIGDKQATANSFGRLASVARFRSDYATARALYQESLALNSEIGNRQGMANALIGLGFVTHTQGDYTTAGALFQESLALNGEVGDKRGVANSLTGLGLVAQAHGEYVTARRLHQESLVLKREVGYKQGMAGTLANLGYLALIDRDYEAAREKYTESLTLLRELGDKRGIADSLVSWASLAQATGQVGRATKLCGAVEGLFQVINARLEPPEREMYERTLTALRTKVDVATFDRVQAEGRALTMEQAIAEAMGPAEMETPVGTAPRGPNDLSPREREVLSLVAEGMSDAQVADKLVVSPRTINAHLTTIYRKLGVKSRSAATRYALDKKLV